MVYLSKVASSRLSWFVAHPSTFRTFMKVKFDSYVFGALTKSFQNSIVDWSTSPNFTVRIRGVIVQCVKSLKLNRAKLPCIPMFLL